MHVLALQKQPIVDVSIVSIDAAQGRVQLMASINDIPVGAGRGEWSVPISGLGTIDKATGLYRTDPSSTSRFTLIFYKTEIEFFGIVEGHLIIPLPLVETPQWLEVLKK
ncbi:hypothetical protein D3C71_1682310 [compost metagenome]